MDGQTLRAPPFFRWVHGAAILCVAAALGLASLLAWRTLAGRPLAVGCGGTSGCATITATRWAFWGPVPVILPAVALYLAMLGGLLALEPLRAARSVRREKLGWTGLATLSFVALGAALWFAAVQGLVLRRYCPLCLATHLCASLGSLLVLWLATGNLPARGGSRWRPSVAAAAGVLTLLVGGQLLLPSSVTRLAPSPVDPAAASPASVRSLALPARDLVLAGGRVHLDAAAWANCVTAASSSNVTVLAA